MNALSQWYNPFPTRLFLPSWYSCGSRTTVVVCWCWTRWMATARAWYEPHQEYVDWGEEDSAGNLACPPSQKWQWAVDFYVRHVGWSCFISALCSITGWVHDTNESTGVLGFLLKRPVYENSPFKGLSINSNFVCVSEILGGKKKSFKLHVFAHNLFAYSKHVKVGCEMGCTGSILLMATHENLWNKL